MKKILFPFLIFCLLTPFAFATETQDKIGQNIGSIRNQTIPSSVRADYNNQYQNNLPSHITTMGEAYDGNYLSDGIDGPLTRYAEGLMSDDDDGNFLGSWGCNYSGVGDIGAALEWCMSGTSVVQSWDFNVEWGFKQKISSWTTTIAGFLALLAVGAIVYGGLLMTLSTGDDEKIKKGKDVVKWSILGFIGVVVAGGLISVLVNFIFAVA